VRDFFSKQPVKKMFHKLRNSKNEKYHYNIKVKTEDECLAESRHGYRCFYSTLQKPHSPVITSAPHRVLVVSTGLLTDKVSSRHL